MNTATAPRPHVGNACPVPPRVPVLIDLGDGQQHLGWSEDFAWGAGVGPDGEGRIHFFSVLAPVQP